MEQFGARGANRRQIPALPQEPLRRLGLRELDSPPHQENAQAAIKRMQQYSDQAQYVEIKGGTHGSAIQIAMPDIFKFFDAHTKKAGN